MKKSERRCLIFATVGVSIILLLIIVASGFAIFEHIDSKHRKGYTENNKRDIFAECAYVAQAQMNCYDDSRKIGDYTPIFDMYWNHTGFCFFFEPSGYVVVTSYDYLPQTTELDVKTPFPDIESSEGGYKYYIYSVQPVSSVLADEGDGSPRKYRTFQAGSFFCAFDSGASNVYSAGGEAFDMYDVIYPGTVLSYREDPAYFKELIRPNDDFRDRMLKVADKQMAESGFDIDGFNEHIESIRNKQSEYEKEYWQHLSAN
jgi:hypothetical protein